MTIQIKVKEKSHSLVTVDDINFGSQSEAVEVNGFKITFYRLGSLNMAKLSGYPTSSFSKGIAYTFKIPNKYWGYANAVVYGDPNGFGTFRQNVGTIIFTPNKDIEASVTNVLEGSIFYPAEPLI